MVTESRTICRKNRYNQRSCIKMLHRIKPVTQLQRNGSQKNQSNEGFGGCGCKVPPKPCGSVCLIVHQHAQSTENDLDITR